MQETKTFNQAESISKIKNNNRKVAQALKNSLVGYFSVMAIRSTDRH